MACKDCECHDFLKQKGLGFNWDFRVRGHYCMAKIIVQYPHGGTGSYLISKPMSYKEAIKIPDWCPKNQTYYMVEEIKCPIIEIKK